MKIKIQIWICYGCEDSEAQKLMFWVGIFETRDPGKGKINKFSTLIWVLKLWNWMQSLKEWYNWGKEEWSVHY